MTNGNNYEKTSDKIYNVYDPKKWTLKYAMVVLSQGRWT
jgi:hypothetical protein